MEQSSRARIYTILTGDAGGVRTRFDHTEGKLDIRISELEGEASPIASTIAFTLNPKGGLDIVLWVNESSTIKVIE